SRWNPKMGPYIFGKRNSSHIIDIRETVKGLLRAKKFLTALVAQGQDVLIVGTKRQARDSVVKQAQRVGMHYVSERWLGGTLTNFKTIRSRLSRLEHLEEIVRTGEINKASKKERARLTRERRKIVRNLDGIRKMTRLPGALVILDIRREHIAVKEARKLNIPTVCLVDTDSDPDGADIVVPGNDDAMRAIEMILTQLADAIEEGKRGRKVASEETGEAAAAGPGHARRSRRLTTSSLAEQQAAPAAPEPETPEAAPSVASSAPAGEETVSPPADELPSPASEVPDGVS
ncbi:MAG: 30S ribosomal protein S2, partial [Phycisphaerae bacterium]